MATASQGGLTAWVVPTYKNGRGIWRWVENTLAPLKRAGRVEINRAERIAYFDNGGEFGIYSADSEDSIRSNAFHLVVIDEAARVAEQAWTDAIQPTLADYDGDAILISTPVGMNWFAREWSLAHDDGKYTASWKAPTSDNPLRTIRAAFEKIAARARDGNYPERAFKQEWLAEFISDGSYFQNVDRCAVVESPDTPDQHQGHAIMGAADWAKSNDYTVLTIGCRDCNRVVDWWRFNQIDYRLQRDRLMQMHNKWHVLQWLIESNSIGEPNLEELQYSGLPIDGFETTATTKPPLIEGLNYAFVQNGFSVPKEFADEYRAYEIVSNNGRTKFGAPAGMHDDTVISTALLWRALTSIPAAIVGW